MFPSRNNKRKLLFFVFWALIKVSIAQVNLVPNPSFEKLVGYNSNLYINSIQIAQPWDTIKGGSGGGGVGIIQTPTIVLGGEVLFQNARTGKFMAGVNYYTPISSKWRGYLRAELLAKLVNEKEYCVTSFFNSINRNQYGCDELSLFFDDGSLECSAPNDVAFANAQIKSPAGIFLFDTLNWMKVQGKFKAIGYESHITIGNFKPQAITSASIINPNASAPLADYFLDDISVIEADLPANAGRDTVLCTGDSVFIGRPPEIGLECIWNSHGSQIGSGGGLWVKPSSTQTFEVTQDVCGLIKKDTIRVQIKPKYNGPPISLTVSSPTTCADKTISLAIQNNPPVLNGYNWLPLGVYVQTNNISASAVVSQNTTFTLNINNLGQDAFCPFQRTASVSVSVPVYTDSPILISNFNPVCPGDTILLSYLNPAPGNTVTYQWLPTSAYSFTTNLSAKSITQLGDTYSLNIMSSGNASICAFTRSLSISVSVADSCFKDPLIPNIFTPNNDNANDQWIIKFPYAYSLQNLFIYDRWGKLIYRREDLNFNKQGFTLIGWDGRNTSGEEMSAGVYFYVLQYTDRSQNQQSVKGNITLLK